MIRSFFLPLVFVLAAFTFVAALAAQGAPRPTGTTEAREALDAARLQQRSARARGEKLERQARKATATAVKARTEAAALAARVQQAEAAIAEAEARLILVNSQRRAVDTRLARKREPLARLTAAMQSMSRRPLTLSALQPGSLEDLVHTRAILDSTIPLVAARTEGLRTDLARVRALEREAGSALSDRRSSETALKQRRTRLTALAEQQRLVARQASGGAAREERRALSLAERARDLDTLVGEFERAGAVRDRLAALPGPVPRPADPAAARVRGAPAPAPSSTAPPRDYQLPVGGRLASGFGEASSGGARQAGLVLLPRARAQVVAPGGGRISFAGPYRGYGNIVIVEHVDGWTSLLTGLASVDVAVGQQVSAGSPVGLATRDAPQIGLELRRGGDPVNPLDHIG